MQNYFHKLLTDLESQLQFVHTEYEVCQKRAEESSVLSKKAYDQLKLFISKYKFKNQSEEIKYFKILKPKLLSRLIYHSKVYFIETKKPQGSDKVKKKYLHNELDKINRYFDNNIDFIRYYRSGETYLDHRYFVRNKIDFRTSHETFSFELDTKQSTSFDFKIAKITIVDETNPNMVYNGFAALSASTAEPVWAIQRVLNTNGILTYQWAGGNKNFDKIWNNRKDLAYS